MCIVFIQNVRIGYTNKGLFVTYRYMNTYIHTTSSSSRKKFFARGNSKNASKPLRTTEIRPDWSEFEAVCTLSPTCNTSVKLVSCRGIDTYLGTDVSAERIYETRAQSNRVQSTKPSPLRIRPHEKLLGIYQVSKPYNGNSGCQPGLNH